MKFHWPRAIPAEAFTIPVNPLSRYVPEQASKTCYCWSSLRASTYLPFLLHLPTTNWGDHQHTFPSAVYYPCICIQQHADLTSTCSPHRTQSITGKMTPNYKTTPSYNSIIRSNIELKTHLLQPNYLDKPHNLHSSFPAANSCPQPSCHLSGHICP